MKNENKDNLPQKTDNRGRFMAMAWQEAKKAGGIAYSPQQIDTILEERDDVMLTREETKQRISAYFQSCMTIAEDENTNELNYVWKKNPTKSGLALILGVSPQTLIDYVKGYDRKGNKYKSNAKPQVQKISTDDFDLVRKAYALIESFYEEKLGDNRNNAGTIFWLNNRENKRWSNEQEFKFSQTDETKEISVRTPEQIEQMYGFTATDSNGEVVLPELPED